MASRVRREFFSGYNIEQRLIDRQERAFIAPRMILKRCTNGDLGLVWRFGEFYWLKMGSGIKSRISDSERFTSKRLYSWFKSHALARERRI